MRSQSIRQAHVTELDLHRDRRRLLTPDRGAGGPGRESEQDRCEQLAHVAVLGYN